MTTAACLAGRGSCDPNANCTGRGGLPAPPRVCLKTPIPAWGPAASYNRIACCFRCCLLTWIRKLGLDANERHWRLRGVDHFVSQGYGGRRREDAPPPAVFMPLDFVLQPRFAISRFAHFLALETRDLDLLNASTPRTLLRSARYRVPGAWRANGTLVVLNRWGHPPELLKRIGEVMPRAGPVTLMYGDDASWRAAEVAQIRTAFTRPPLVRHFAMNLDAEAADLVHMQQVPIGLNSACGQLPALLAPRPPPPPPPPPRRERPHGARSSARVALPTTTLPEPLPARPFPKSLFPDPEPPPVESPFLESLGSPVLPPALRDPQLLCCCHRPWPYHRVRIFEQLRLAGHTHCNLSNRLPYHNLFGSYLRHRFVVSVYAISNHAIRY